MYWYKGEKEIKKGHYMLKYGMDLSSLVLGEVETRGSTQYVGKPLP